MKSLIKKGRCFIFQNRKALIGMGIMTAALVVPILFDPGICHAATSDLNAQLPWSKGIGTLSNELTGPLPKIGATIAVATTGAMLAFGEANGLTKRAMQIVLGLGTAVGAVNLVDALTGATVAGCLF